MTSETPYTAPSATLNESGALLNSPVDIIKCSAGQGGTWFINGIKLTFQAPFTWLLIGLINFGLLLLFMLVGLIPVIGSFIPSLFYPLIVAGFMVAASNQEHGQLRVKDLFAGFSRQTGQLFMNGALYIAMTIGITIIAVLLLLGLGFLFFSTLQSQDKDLTLMLLVVIGVLIVIGLLLPAIMAVWFSPALIILFEMDAITGIKYSFKGCARNFVPYIIYSLVALFVMLLVFLFFAALTYAASPGTWQGNDPDAAFWLVLVIGVTSFSVLFAPIFFNSVYESFKDVFQLKQPDSPTSQPTNAAE